MAMLFMDGFDHYATADLTKKYGYAGQSTIISSNEGRRGGGCATSNGLSVGLKVGLNDAATIIAGIAFKTVLGTPFRVVIENTAGGLYCIAVSINSDGSVSAIRFNGGGSETVLGSSAPGRVRSSLWYYLECKFTIDNAAGVVTARLNGEEVLALTSQDTLDNGGSATAKVLNIYAPVNSSIAPCLDDIYACDTSGAVNNDFLGDLVVDAHFPTGAGSVADFAPSAGANWQNVDDATPDGDSTKNTSNTSNHKDSFVFEDLKYAGGTIKAVQVLSCWSKDRAGTAQVKNRLEISASEYLGAAFYPSLSSYNYARDVFNVSPATSVAFTESEFNGMQVGYKRIA